MTEERLARRYHALLAFYPRRYREERGEELVATLLDAARPGQARPTWREARSLLVEGLRMRAPRAAAAESLRVTVLVALAMWTLATTTALLFGGVVSIAVAVPLGACGLVSFVLVALGRVRPAVPFVLACVLIGAAVSTVLRGVDVVASLHLPTFAVVALGGLAALWRSPAGRNGAGTGVLVFATVPSLLLWAPAWLPYDGPIAPDDLYWYGLVLPVALVYLAALAYVAVDPRPAWAMAVFLLLFAVQVVGVLVPGGVSLAGPANLLVVVLAAAAIAAVAAVLGARRQVAALPAKIEG